VSCEPEKVTALVDDALAPGERDRVSAHLAGCPGCREQADTERAIHQQLRRLPAPEMPPGLDTRLRARLAERPLSPPGRFALLALPVAAALLLVLWARGLAPVVAWELSHDHARCYSHAEPPARVRSSDPAVVVGWFAGQGTPMPNLPAEVAGTRLLGARYCYLPDVSAAPHVYYRGPGRRLSIFVLPHAARFGDGYRARSGGRTVALLHLGPTVVGVVGENAADVDTAVQRLRADPARASRGARGHLVSGRAAPCPLSGRSRQQIGPVCRQGEFGKP